MTKTPFTTLTDDFLVYGQITPDDVATAAAAGVRLIINNRPDDEEPGQPAGSAIEQAANNAGVAYVAIPVGPAGLSPDHLDAFERATADHPGLTLGFCKSGFRSVMVHALVEARRGGAIDDIVAAAGAAGYDIAGHRALLESVQAQ